MASTSSIVTNPRSGVAPGVETASETVLEGSCAEGMRVDMAVEVI